MIDSSMLPDFIIEALEHLQELESSLLRLEKHQEDKDVLNDIFRSMHTIKGAAQFVGIDRVSELSHKLENLLDLIRREEQPLDENILDLLIDGKDRISLLVDELERTQAEDTDVDDLLLRIKNTVERAHETAPETPAGAGAGQEDVVPASDEHEDLEAALDSLFDDSTESSVGMTAGQENALLVTDENESLEAALDSALSDTFDPPSEDAEQENNPAALENEVLGEGQDEELLDIFIQQLKENIPFLHSQIAELATCVDKQDVLNRCSNAIKSLKSSANYMGYEKLTRHYTTWQETIDGTVAQLSTDEDPELAFMQSFIDEIVRVYPQAMEDEAQDEAISDSDGETIVAAIDALFDDSSESPAEMTAGQGDAFPVSDEDGDFEDALDSALSDAFDEPSEDADQDDKPAALESEIIGEKYDEKLLKIFMQQLKEDIPFLHSQAAEIATCRDRHDVLNRCSNAIKRLKSSANYMGYVKLTHYYTTWREAIDRAVAQLIADGEPELGFMQSFIDEIVRVYPQAMEDALPVSDEDVEAALDSALSEAFDEPSQDAEQDDKPAALESEAFEEEYDEELLDIFMQQFKENVTLLHSKTAELATCVDRQEVLNHCSNTIKSLKSSANYMGYEKLTHHYTSWQEAIDGAVAQLSAGGEPELGFMQSFIDEIIRAYPQTMDGEGQKETSTAVLHEQEDGVTDGADEFEDLTDTIGALLSETPVASADDLEAEATVEEFENDGMVAAEEQEFVAAVSDSDEEDPELFDKLSIALDASMEQTENAPAKPMHGVIKEMIATSSEEMVEEEVSEVRSPPVTMEEAPDREVPVSKDLSTSAEIPADTVSSAKDEAVTEKLDRCKEERRQEERRLVKRRSREDAAGKKIKQSMRVDADKIDFLMNQVGELVVSRAYFAQLFTEMKGLQQNLMENSDLTKSELKPLNEFAFRLGEAGVALGRVSNELQEGVMKVRMLPIDQLFKRYPRLVRDLVHKTDKQVKLETRGAETELDKMVIEQISDPLIHIIRNAVDHGIETTKERKRAGKPESGTLTLEAYHESDHIVIEVTDDGRGLDVDRVKSKALAMGLHSSEELDRMSQLELMYLVMQPGFSTAERTTKTSGRGVGMDVVKKNIEKLNGSVEIETKTGEGTRIRIKIPLTMAIIQALMVRVGTEKFTIPLRAVEETLRIFQQDISEIEGVDVIHLRDTTMPIFKLSRIFGIDRAAQDDEKFFVVVVRTGMQSLGLVVDELLGQEEVVIKPLADYLRQGSGFAGATILGNGGISLILDIPELLKMTTDKQVSKQQKLNYRRRIPDTDAVEQQARIH